MIFGSLFSGIGGLDLGLERAGMVCAWQVEIDEFCRKVLAKHWPGIPKFEDVKECGRANLDDVDLICGGFPCQPVSCAGERKGERDDRWLWPEFLRIICELRPRWVLAENVRGLLSIDDGRIFGGILRDLASVGYDAEWQVVPASAVGAHHQRERVFVVAYDDGSRRQRSRIHVRPRRQDETQGQSNGPSPKLPHDDRKRLKDDEGQCSTVRAHRPTIFGPDARRPEKGWAIEPNVGRVVDGVPGGLDRLKGLGNAVVPQVAEYIGRLILKG